MDKMTLAINLQSKKGKYFVKTVLPVCKHMVTVKPNKSLVDGKWVDYILDSEDYYKCQDLLKKFES